MNKPILIRGARQLLTLRGPSVPRRGADLRSLGIIEDGAVLIKDGLILQVGASRRLDNIAESRDAEEIDASGRVLMPGFVDSHTHILSGPARGLDYEAGHHDGPREIFQAAGGPEAIFKYIQETPVRSLESQAWHILQDFTRHGTTMIEAKSGYGVNESCETKILRAQAALGRRLNNVVSTFMAARFLPEACGWTPETYVDWICSEMLPRVRRRQLAEFFDLCCDDGMFTLEQSRRMLISAKALGFGLKVHAGEFHDQGGVRLATELGAVSVDHAVYLGGADTERLVHSSSVVTLLPGTIFYRGHQRYAAARSLIEDGVAIALATGFDQVTCPTGNMQMIVALACRKMDMTPAAAISAATVNGACAMNQGHRLGSIMIGKQADLIMLSVSDYREIPSHFGVNLVEMTMKEGRVVHRASEVGCNS